MTRMKAEIGKRNFSFQLSYFIFSKADEAFQQSCYANAFHAFIREVP